MFIIVITIAIIWVVLLLTFFIKLIMEIIVQSTFIVKDEFIMFIPLLE